MAELSQAKKKKKKSCFYDCRVALVVSGPLQPCRLWPARLLCQGGVFSRQEYCSILTNIGCHTLLEHYISCCLVTNSPEYLMLPESLWPKQWKKAWSWKTEMGQVFQLLVEDIMEQVVQVVVWGGGRRCRCPPRSRSRSHRQITSGTQSRSPKWLAGAVGLDVQAGLQVELSSGNAKNNRVYFWLKQKNNQSCKGHLDHSSAINQGIPGFWAKAVSQLLFLWFSCSR